MVDGKGGRAAFDHIVMATHSDVTLKILGDLVSAGQREVLEGVPYAANDVYLHRDPVKASQPASSCVCACTWT